LGIFGVPVRQAGGFWPARYFIITITSGIKRPFEHEDEHEHEHEGQAAKPFSILRGLCVFAVRVLV
jgi:hypothetical protein